METIATRLSYMIEELELSKIEFGRRIGVSSSYVSQMCQGDKTPSDRLIKSICQEFDINIEWLRTGEGEMKRETPRTIVDELAKKYNLTPSVTWLLDTIAHTLLELDEDQADRIIELLRIALADLDAARLDAQAVRAAMNEEGPDESGPEVKERSQAE